MTIKVYIEVSKPNPSENIKNFMHRTFDTIRKQIGKKSEQDYKFPKLQQPLEPV